MKKDWLTNLKFMDPEVNQPRIFNKRAIQRPCECQWSVNYGKQPGSSKDGQFSAQSWESSASLPGSDLGDFSLTCGGRTHSSAGYAIHLANEGFILLGQPTTIIYAVCPALRDVLEVPFAITSKSVAPASWLPSMYGKPEFPIPYVLLMTNTTYFVAYRVQSNCTIQEFWWQ